MDAQTHWESIYRSKVPDAVSWDRPHLDVSLDLIERRAAGRSTSIIDVGAGESTLVADLVSRGYHELTVLDVSTTSRRCPSRHSRSMCGMIARCFTS